MVSAHAPADVIIIGDGVIGLSTALELGRAGANCVLIGDRRHGAASNAAAGLLAPTVGHLDDAVRPFFMASLDAYPEFVERLRAFDPELRIIEGLIERGPTGDQLHPRDGAIDNVRLTGALRAALRAQPTVRVLEGSVVEIGATGASGHSRTVLTSGGDRHEARVLVIAGGAWSSEIKGLPRPLPIFPLKGQMIALGISPLERAVMGNEVYLVPRAAETLVGATVERAGFDTTVTQEAVDHLRAAAAALCPGLAGAPVVRSWAGIRPATPDMLPILGPDEDDPGIFYACGHSKNGILLAPATAITLAALALGEPSTLDWRPFALARFARVIG